MMVMYGMEEPQKYGDIKKTPVSYFTKMWIEDHPVSILPGLRHIDKRDCLTEKGTFQMPEKFYIHCMNREVVEEHHRHEPYDDTRWREFWKLGRIFVKPAIQINNEL